MNKVRLDLPTEDKWGKARRIGADTGTFTEQLTEIAGSSAGCPRLEQPLGCGGAVQAR